MRIRTAINLFTLGIGVGAYLGYRATRAPRATGARRFADLDLDEVSDLEVSPLDVDAMSNEDVEAAQDLAALEADADEDDDEEVEVELETARPSDAGDLYGVHTPVAVDRTHPDDDRAVADGQNWIEALETSAIENGAAPGRPLDDIVDDEELLRTPHRSSRRDTPVADLGSGGRRGL